MTYGQTNEEVLEEAKEIKESLKLDNLTEALLIIISRDLDLIRFHNTE